MDPELWRLQFSSRATGSVRRDDAHTHIYMYMRVSIYIYTMDVYMYVYIYILIYRNPRYAEVSKSCHNGSALAEIHCTISFSVRFSNIPKTGPHWPLNLGIVLYYTLHYLTVKPVREAREFRTYGGSR